MLILFLCRQKDMNRERSGYARAFQKRGVHLAYVDAGFPLNGDVQALIAHCSERPSLIIQPESAFALLPWGLTKVDIPTACFQIDTHVYTQVRIYRSMLFDYALLCHPGFEDQFKGAGHVRPVTLPHAVEAEFFKRSEEKRSFEVGWVGTTDHPLYQTRRRILTALAEQFQMNKWWQHYSYEELAEIYKRSRIVVNIGRDDVPQDVSLRFAEAMASGALFITKLPTELTMLGFEEGIHFIGYRDEREVIDLVRHYLGHEAERLRITEAGREKVLREHTYDCRVEMLLQTLEQDKGRLFAPARQWPEERVRLIYLHYFSSCRLWGCARTELLQIARSNPKVAARALLSLARRGVRRLARGVSSLG
jgi:hypothetical protein